VTNEIRVLIVEDCADTATSLAILLRYWEMDVAIVRDGKSALAYAARWAPDVILLDLGLPDMPGLDVLRDLRAMFQLDDTIILVVSGYATSKDREDSLHAGCQAHLAKPVDPDQLHLLILNRLKEFRRQDAITPSDHVRRVRELCFGAPSSEF
jgi:CheY-like chemotaxis protein